MKKSLMLAAVCAFAGFASAQAPEKELRAVEEQRYKAMLQADVPALEKLLADDLVYVHSSGGVESKQQFLATIRSGALKYKKIAPEGVFYRISDSLAVVTGKSSIEVEREGKPQSFRVRFTAVYQKSPAGWRLAAWQTTRLPES